MRRLLAFLPMLLLATALAAQIPCQISNLSVLWAPGPAPCQYFAILTFEHTGTTNQYTVQGNGQNYGTFPYTQLPLVLGPFTAGAQPDTLEFVVTDAVIQGCQAVAVKVLPACNTGGTDCAITNVQLEVGDCLPNAPAFQLWLNFEVQNPTNDFFELWTSGGQYLGIYPLGLLPLNIPAFPWNGGPVQELKICINDNPDCCTIVQFSTPPCINPAPPCTITDLTATVGDCTSDSTFAVMLDFNVLDSTQVDSFFVTANGQFLGAFGFNQLPLKLDSLDWNGFLFSHISVCTGNLPGCCREIQIIAPDCLPFEPCEVLGLFTNAGPCTSDSTYKLRVNFQATNPGIDSFVVYANGELLGQFPLTAAPLTFDSFPWGGGNFDVLKLCVLQDSSTAPCCRTQEIAVPGCLTQPDSCGIVDLVVDTGNCTSDSTYSLWVNFHPLYPDQFVEYNVYANGELIGTYPLDSLPLHLEHFPWNGGQNDVIKICLIDNNVVACCAVLEFPVPDCLGNPDPCEIFDLVVDPGTCTSDSTYNLWVNFQVQNPPANQFQLWANGQLFGTYNLNQLPLNIPNFPWNGGANDVVKVCFGTNSGGPSCCRTLEFPVPDCLNPGGNCEIYNLAVDTGDCTGDSTYVLYVNFLVQNPPSQIFVLYANGVAFGTYNLNQLPLTISNFPWNGGQNDVIKVCMADQGAVSGCCRTLEFPVPDCLNPGGPCEIYDLEVETGDCHPDDSTYVLVVNFQVQNPPSSQFQLWANGQPFGTYNLGQLPLTIPNFPWNGGPNDVVKVCMFGPNNTSNCCRTLEFPVPDCFDPGGPCEIYDLEVETGDCHPDDSTYVLVVNFQVQNPPSNQFQLWANGQLFGTYNLSQLPLTIPNFPWNGGPNDVVKVCMFAPNNTSTCCRTLEFPVPDCLNPGGPCEVYDLVVDTGDCTSDSTYSIWINFQVQNPPSGQFALWANGQFFGTYNLSQLPLNIQNFPWNGGPNDYLKVCIVTPGAPSACCRTIEYPVPDCLGGPNDDCHIYDLQVLRTPCLCGQFFAIVTFEHDNGGAAGFSIVGNGNNYGMYPYNHPQPIILGPFTIWNFIFSKIHNVFRFQLKIICNFKNCVIAIS